MVKITKEQESLVVENHDLIYWFLYKNNLSVDDWYDVAAIGLCNAACKFNAAKSKFSTYAYKGMLNAYLNEKRKESFAKRIPDYKIVYHESNLKNEADQKDISILNTFPSNDNIETDVINRIMLEKYMASIKPETKAIIILILQGYTQQELADKFNCSQAKISRVRKKIREYIFGEK